MDKSVENKTEIKDKIINFFSANKVKIFIFGFILVTALTSFIFFKLNNEKKNIIIAEKYVEAGLYLASNKKDIATSLYEEIILSNNKIYSILALNTLIEKDLIIDKNKILDFFNILEKSISTENQADLISLKKGLYLIKKSDIKNGEIILKKLANSDSIFKNIAIELIKK